MEYNKQYKYSCKVEFEDCDMQNIVHHPKLLCYLERARLAVFDNENFNYKTMLDNNVSLVVTDMKLKFIAPCLLGDKLTIITQVTGVYAHSIKLNQMIIKENDCILPIKNWLNYPNSSLCASIRFSIVDIKNREPHQNIKHIYKKLNIKEDNFTIKDMIFKHPYQ